ncbi:MAG: hypothetical protein J6P28_03175 [Treponema sp.]|nr:hypothetical protein [Treponema sp.]
MTKEEMAEEWVKENMDCVKTVSYLNHDCNYFSDEVRSIAKSAFKDGYNKANEWHYPSKGELPKDGETVFVCRDDMQIWTGNRHSKRENSYFWYIHNLHGVLYKDSDIYAWKEIVLPKEE